MPSPFSASKKGPQAAREASAPKIRRIATSLINFHRPSFYPDRYLVIEKAMVFEGNTVLKLEGIVAVSSIVARLDRVRPFT